MKLLLIAATALACAAIVVLLAGKGTASDAVGLGLAGLACAAVIEAVFYAVGAGEDRERAGRSGGRRRR